MTVKLWFENVVVKRIIKKHFKLWGVNIEPSVAGEDIKPEFVITYHAHDRMLERLKCNEEKIKKVAIKSWYSKEKVCSGLINAKEFIYDNDARCANEKIHYRRLMGYIFIWKVKWVGDWPQKILITMY